MADINRIVSATNWWTLALRDIAFRTNTAWYVSLASVRKETRILKYRLRHIVRLLRAFPHL